MHSSQPPQEVPVFYFDLDITGTKASNTVISERHTLPNTSSKVIKPNYGAYYTKSLSVYSVNVNNGTRTLLVNNVDYNCVDIDEEYTVKTGNEICHSIFIKPTVSNVFDIGYQALGGHDSPSIPALQNAITLLDINTKPVNWYEIINKPKEFPPADHLHDSKDLYGLEFLVKELGNIAKAITPSDSVIHGQIMNEINTLNNRLNTLTLIYTSTEINNLTALTKIADDILILANKKLAYSQLKYDAAEKFFNEVNTKFLNR